MKRIDKIQQYLEISTKQLKIEDLMRIQGFTTAKISEALGFLRSNVSKELNELVRLGKIIKVKGRPVYYLHKEGVEQILNIKLPVEPMEINNLNEIITSFTEKEENPFNLLIGAEDSLKNQVEQAKAAILYPPTGLHSLIVGQTGVGKTLFANLMYNYGKYVKKFDEKTPFIVFNCADYYNNPQLLLSQIFGHIKGAFTGADCEKQGLVGKANGGILFLDEIHRLPPEGQEMLFYFMDTGTYSKLGETERNRKSLVLIIGATTEDPNSYMLKTFIRRIPIIINIPSLNERTFKEKIDIIKYLFSKEAQRINKPIRISTEVIKALIGSASYGNIGQLKSNIQLICAKGFLYSINNKNEPIELDFKTLPPNIKDRLFEIGSKRKEFEEIANVMSPYLLIAPQGDKKLLLEKDHYELPFNLYKIIEDKANILKQEGMDDEYINKFITTDINIHIKSFYNQFKHMENKKENLLRIVDKDILEFAEEIKNEAEEKLKRRYNDRFVYALSLHLSAFFKRLKEEKYIKNTDTAHIMENHPKEFNLALEIKDTIEKRYNVKVPKTEVVYITILLASVHDVKDGKVGIIVATHGNNTASSMVNVATKLLGEGPICAIDMPLEVSPKEILEVIAKKVKEMDSGKGVLLLVDMGSLCNIESLLVEKTGIKIKTIDMVSTPLVIEAIRKANIFDMNLKDIYSSLKEFKGYNQRMEKNDINASDRVIITICSSGEGTAVKLKQLIEDIIYNLTEEKIQVIPVGISHLDKNVKKIEEEYKIIAAVGIKKPDLNVPFVPLEKLIDGNGEKLIREIITRDNQVYIPQEPNIVVKDLCEDNLKQFLTYLNPDKIIHMLFRFIKILEKEFDTEFNNSLKIKLIIHVGCALERVVMKDSLKYNGDFNKFDIRTIQNVDKACKIFEDSLQLSLIDDEKYYICEIID